MKSPCGTLVQLGIHNGTTDLRNTNSLLKFKKVVFQLICVFMSTDSSQRTPSGPRKADGLKRLGINTKQINMTFNEPNVIAFTLW